MKKLTALVLIFLIVTAVSLPVWAHEDTFESTIEEWKDYVWILYLRGRWIATSLATLYVAYNALYYAGANDQKAEQAKHNIIVACLTLAGLYTLPLLINIGRNILPVDSWRPGR